MFFGFTHCPEVCPTALFDISEILNKLGPDADKVNALFITVDPERDTPAVLKDYLSSFNPRLIGVGGDADALAAVAKAYRVYYKKVPLKDGDYTMDHTAIVYLMDKNGQFVAPFSLKRRPEDAAADLRRYLLSTIASRDAGSRKARGAREPVRGLLPAERIAQELTERAPGGDRQQQPVQRHQQQHPAVAQQARGASSPIRPSVAEVR